MFSGCGCHCFFYNLLYIGLWFFHYLCHLTLCYSWPRIVLEPNDGGKKQNCHVMSLFTQFFFLYPYVVILELWALLSLQHPFVFLQVVGWDPKFDRRRKIVVITARLLSDAHRFVLRCLSTHQGVCNCTIFTSISEVRCSHWLLACLPIRYNSYL